MTRKIVVISRQQSGLEELQKKNSAEKAGAATTAEGSVARVEWVPVAAVDMAAQHPDAMLYIDLDFDAAPERIAALNRLLPVPVFVNSVTAILRDIGCPFVRISAWTGFLAREVHELVFPDPATEDRVRKIYEELGWKYAAVPDIPGMVSARVLASVINEAYFTLQENVSTRAEIDTAMKLGTNYPKGPFEWSEQIGLEKVQELLSVLSETDSRYRISEALVNDAEVRKAVLKH